ncbi:MAG: AraC family transcriptional regulator, partial [Rhodoglobus sp.]
HLQRPGGLLVCDVNEPFMRGFAQGLEEFAVRIPKSVFSQISQAPFPKQPMTMSFSSVPGANANAAALAVLVRDTLASPDVEAHALAEQTALHLLRTIFSADEASGTSSHRRAAIAFIDRNLRDPRLSVALVARGIDISERQMSRAFNESGSGLARIILEKRLDLAYRMLSGGKFVELSVGDIAAFCGFSSHSHFARVFRERFEETPAHFRSGRG